MSAGSGPGPLVFSHEQGLIYLPCPSMAAYVFRAPGPWVQYVWSSGVNEELDVPVRWLLALHPRTSEQDSVIDG